VHIIRPHDIHQWSLPVNSCRATPYWNSKWGLAVVPTRLKSSWVFLNSGAITVWEVRSYQKRYGAAHTATRMQRYFRGFKVHFPPTLISAIVAIRRRGRKWRSRPLISCCRTFNLRHTEVVATRRGTCLERADISLVERRAQKIPLHWNE
jgi:hypothetical protein